MILYHMIHKSASKKLKSYLNTWSEKPDTKISKSLSSSIGKELNLERESGLNENKYCTA